MEKKDKPVLRHMDAEGYRKWRSDVKIYIGLYGSEGVDPKTLVAAEVYGGLENQWEPLMGQPWTAAKALSCSDFLTELDKLAGKIHSTTSFMRDMTVKRYKDGSIATMELVGDFIRLAGLSKEPLSQKQEFLLEILKSEPELCIARKEAEELIAANSTITIPEITSKIAVALANGNLLKKALTPSMVNINMGSNASNGGNNGGNSTGSNNNGYMNGYNNNNNGGYRRFNGGRFNGQRGFQRQYRGRGNGGGGRSRFHRGGRQSYSYNYNQQPSGHPPAPTGPQATGPTPVQGAASAARP